MIQPVGEKVGVDKVDNPIYQIDANGIKIGYKLIGSGEPLVMIMGLSCSMDYWPSKLVDLLSQKYQLILVDNRGIGCSTATDEPFSIKLFAEDIVALLDALRIEKAHVFGFSLGGTITQKLLLDYPKRCDKAIIYASIIDGKPVVEAVKSIMPKDPISQRQLEASSQWKTPLDKLALITNPVMVMVGTSDDIVDVESSKILATTIPGAWLIQIKNRNHLMLKDIPTEIAQIGLLFLAV